MKVGNQFIHPCCVGKNPDGNGQHLLMRRAGTAPLLVQVKVEKLNPVVKLIYCDTLMLGQTRDEKTVVRLTLNGQDLTGAGNTPKSLVELTRPNGSKDTAATPAPQPMLSLDGATGTVVQK